jgi:hypothetical protein
MQCNALFVQQESMYFLLVHSQTKLLVRICFKKLYSQRNVGILEKIVQSMTASSQRRMLSDELSMQYSAQIDVLGQLEDKIRRQMKEQPAQATVQKLQRDFDRVEARVKELQGAVERWKEQKKKMAAASAAANTHTPAVTAADHERQQQLQLQEDVSYILSAECRAMNIWLGIVFSFSVCRFFLSFFLSLCTALARRDYARTRRRNSEY